MLTLANPWWLLTLSLPIIVLFWRQWRDPVTENMALNKAHTLAISHPQAELLSQLESDNHQHGVKKMPWLWLIGCAALALALARPQWLNSNQLTSQDSRDIMLAIDISASMRAEDFVLQGQTVSRLTAVQHVINQFIEKRQGDRLGIIIFADDAYTLAPLTQDLTLISDFLRDLRLGLAGEKTALGNAIALATKRLNDHSKENRVMVLFSDGANTTGAITPSMAIQIAQEEGIRIYTVGIGSHRRVAFPNNIIDPINLTEMPLDEALLQRIAEQTGGQYFVGENTQTLQKITATIDQIETVEQDKSIKPKGADWYWLPLLFGLGLLFIDQRRECDDLIAPH